MNNDKTLSVTKSSNSTIGENFAERVLFLIPEKYERHILSDYTCQINVISPDEINGDVVTATLTPSNNYKKFLEFNYDISDEFTAQTGYISFWLKFLGTDNLTIIQTVGEAKVPVKERRGIEGYIPEHSLSLLDEWTFKMEENNQISEDYYNKSKEEADKSEDARLLSESYARGDTGIRENENIDNAKYYKNQTQALRDETENFKNQAEESEYNAKQSEIKVVESEQNVEQIEGVVDGILHDIIEIEENVIEIASEVQILANDVEIDKIEIEILKNQTITNAQNAAESEDSAKKASDDTKEYANNAKDSERLAEEAKETAITNRNETESFAEDAEKSKQAIENMTVTSETLQPNELVKVKKTIIDNVVNLHYSIPQGEKGETGNVYFPIFYLNNDMELIVEYGDDYDGNIDFTLDDNGCLILEAIT